MPDIERLETDSNQLFVSATVGIFFTFDKAQRGLELPPPMKSMSIWRIGETNQLIQALQLRLWADQFHIITIIALQLSFLALYSDTV